VVLDSNTTTTTKALPSSINLGPLLYLVYTADLPTSPQSTTATFANDTAVVAMDSDPAIASQKLQTGLLAIQDWFKKWRIKAKKSKLIHVTFTTRRETCPPVHINSVQLPPEEDVKYLELHLNRRLIWHKHIVGASHMSDNRQMSVAMQRLVDLISMVTNSTLLHNNTVTLLLA
jgi:hypothetical protein